MPESVLTSSAFSVSAIWRQQVGNHLRRRRHHGPRNLAVVTYLVRGHATNKLIDIRRLTVCVLHDEFDQAGAPTIRFAAYRLSQIALGITVGGPDQILLDKDLALAPRRRAYGRRFARCDQRWLPLALRMDRWLQRHARHPFCPRSAVLRLPKFWVALQTNHVTGDGPEFARWCQDFGWPAEEALRISGRRYRGQVLYPLEFVSHAWRQFRKVYADVANFFQRQVVRLDGSDQLAGFQGACQYDLLNSPHRRMPD